MKSSICWLAAATLLVFPGCILPEQEKPARPDAPLLRTPAARSLTGKTLADLAVVSDETTPKVAIDSHTVRDLAAKVAPSVVSIFTRTSQSYRVHLLPIKLPLTHFPVSLPGQGLGSGFFIHPSGYVLTNNHVIQNAKDVRILTRGGDELGVTVLARDPVLDLALLKVKGEGPFQALPLGDSNQIQAGDLSVAVGNPLGLGHTVTFGIISQTDRNLSGVQPEEGRNIHFLQVDTPINPGSSGGPLISLGGYCVGVNTAGIVTAQNIGFAVPSEQVKEFLAEVLAGQGVEKP